MECPDCNHLTMYHDGAGCKEQSCGCKTTGRLLRGETGVPWHAKPKVKQFLIMFTVAMAFLILSNFLNGTGSQENPRATGDELFWAGKHKETLPYYNKILEKDPSNLYALSKKCDILRFLNLYHDALNCYDKAIAIHPDSFILQDGKKSIDKLLSKQKD